MGAGFFPEIACRPERSLREDRVICSLSPVLKGSMLSTISGSFSILSSRQKLAVGLLAVATLFINTLDIVALTLLGLLGTVTLGEGLPEYLSFLGEIDQSAIIMTLMLVAAAIFAVKTVAGILLARVRQFYLAKLEVHFSELIAQQIFLGDLHKINQFSRANMEWAILRSTFLAFSQIIGAALSLFAEVTLTIFILALFFYTDWLSALLVVVYFSIVLAIFQATTRQKISRTGKDFVDGSLSVGQAISDTLQAFREISVHTRVPYFLGRISKARKQTALGNALQSYMQQIPRLVVELALILGAIGFAAFQFSATDGALDYSILSIFIVGSLRMMSSLLPLYRSYMQLRFLAPQASKSQDLVREYNESPVPRPLAKRVRAAQERDQQQRESCGISVSVEDVSFSYFARGQGAIAINQVSMAIEPGSAVAIIGPSGAGKSTLVDLILGLLEPTSGTVTIAGLPPKTLRLQTPGIVSYVPQKPGLISGSILENIALGLSLTEVDHDQLWAVARIAHIDRFIKNLPDGIHSNLGQHSNSLSGGQLQRIGLARALYTNPRLLVLDEATSALDAETEASISESLEKLRGQTTTVTVAHRLSTVQHADKVFVIDKGRLIASGKLKELENSVPLVRKYIALMSFDS